MQLFTLALISSACMVSGAVLALHKQNGSLPVMPEVDLTRYQGKWFEIARLPARFERKCAGDVTAEYTLELKGTVCVVNSCREANGHLRQSKGTAELEDPRGPASKLKVRFFWPFYGKYWILGLDPHYRWALVGTPDRRYLWILSRSPHLDRDIYTRILDKARDLGFNTSRVRRTHQTGSI
jgi:apolipoprotein D and lipocalin family protein